MEASALISKEDLLPKSCYSSSNVLLYARGLRKAFGGQVVLNNISLKLRQGEVVLLRGENGSGKTTLLNVLTGNIEPDSGDIHVNVNGSKESFVFPRPWWRELNPFDHFTPERLSWEGIGRLWQDIRLFSTMKTLDNVLVASPRQAGENPALALLPTTYREEKKDKKAAAEWLKRFGLGGRSNSSCDKISLGQMKRVALARAIQAGAKLLFLDEPLSGLDAQGITEFMAYLRALVKEHSVTLIIVEHSFNISRVLELASTVWTLSKGHLWISDADKVNESNNRKGSSIDDLLQLIAGDQGEIVSNSLPNGAKITTVLNPMQDHGCTVIEIKDLKIKRGIRSVLDNLFFHLQKGQVSILKAPNGWGKTSLLDVIAGVYRAESGMILFKGIDIRKYPTHERIRMGIAYLRSQQSIFPSLSVDEQRRLSKTRDYFFNESPDKNRLGSLLSGGEKQKLSIEMLPEADVYLLDEPTIGLDDQAIHETYDLIRRMAIHGKTILITEPDRL